MSKTKLFLMDKIVHIFIVLVLSSISLRSQTVNKKTSANIYHSIQKLNFLGKALYIAAHPDDENTRLISYLSNHTKATTAYLSLTRGDGGQNLIGTELRELLGVLRTQELLAARRVDGGQQFFSRANDFGYSKHPDETLKIWNKREVLGDVVRIIRNFKPDVIINRFDHRSPGKTHGHHTSSAMLSVEAFDLVNDPKAYPDQLTSLDLWQPKRLFFNTSWWFYGSKENFDKADKSKMMGMDVGTYYPLLGISNNEIASVASSQHLCQGFGRLNTRGSQNEYIELLKGDLPVNKNNIFDGIDTSWSRVEGGKEIGAILYKVENNFDFTNPAKHLTELLKAHSLIRNLKDEHWKTNKLEEIESIILAVTGLYLEASAESANTNPGNSSKISIEAVNRSTSNITLKSVMIANTNLKVITDKVLKNNQKQNFEINLKVPENTKYTTPYWLNEKGTLGTYKVSDATLIGKAETPRAFFTDFLLDFEGYQINFRKPIIYRYAKRDKGELYKPFEILPEVTARFSNKVLIFADEKSKQIPITIKAHKDQLKGEVEFVCANGWTVDKKTKSFSIENKGDEQIVIFSLTPPTNEDESYISLKVRVNGKVITKELATIAYDHIPEQSVLLPAEAKVVRLNIQRLGKSIGYINGAGDAIPTSLNQIGYQVETIDPATIQEGGLTQYDAIVLGIRAYNVVKDLKFKQKYLFDFVKDGGNLIVQYNTASSRNKQLSNIAPYDLKLSRDRVTDENSEVRILAKDHDIVNFPNKIGEEDFNGWVQERGLYFPNEWSNDFTPILSMKDKGESEKKGSLLIAPYGKGNYIYTGLSFFRELPAGVSGAYKLFANMLSLGKEKVSSTAKVKG